MYKIYSNQIGVPKGYVRKLLLIMRLTIVILIAAFMQVSASGFAQKISLSEMNVPLIKIFNKISDQCGYDFILPKSLLKNTRPVSIEVKNMPLAEALEKIFKNQPLEYSIRDQSVVVKEKEKIFSESVIDRFQAVEIRGAVIDEEGKPLPSVSVRIKGNNKVVITDTEGRFTISVPDEHAILVFSFVGYTTKEAPAKQGMVISLATELNNLSETIVVGYGVQKKVNLTGAVSAVKGSELLKRPVMNTTAALQGIAPGVTVAASSGQPGKEGESIRIRGIGTLNDNNPLILVDGVASSLNAVNPNDIETISILKDAASASIYGSRAANGVILITTKRATSGKFNINFSSNLGLQTLVDQPKFLGALDFLQLYDVAASNDGRGDNGNPGGVTYGPEYIERYRQNMGSDPYTYPNTNWADITYKSPVIQQQYNLSLSGGTEKLSVFSSINYQRQEGIFPGTYMNRYGLRLNTDYKFSKKLSVGLDINGRYSLVSEPNNAAMTMGEVRRTAPIYAPLNKFGQPLKPALGTNTYVLSQESFTGFSRDAIREPYINAKLSYAPLKDLNFDFSYSPRFNFGNNRNYSDQIQYYNLDGVAVNKEPAMRNITLANTYNFNDDIKLIGKYAKSLGTHNFSILGGFQQISDYTESLTAFRENAAFDYAYLNAFPELNQKGSGGATEWALQSYFGRLNYDYKGKYLMEGNIRYDGSSRFAKGYKWGLFPSFSAGWRFSEENFLKNLTWLDNAKIRGSWGKLGNQTIGSDYPFSMDINLNQPIIFNQLVSEGYAITNFAFRDISWETTQMTNLGLDLNLFNSKIDLVFDYYWKTTSDILLSMDIPAVTGFANQPKQNAGIVKNRGWDLGLSTSGSKGELSYKITAVVSDVINKVVDMNGINQTSGIQTIREGYPINSLWGLQDAGLFPTFQDARAYTVTQFGKLQGGDIKYQDQLTVDSDGDGIFDKGDGIINAKDFQVIGNTIPRYTYSLNAFMKYKGFDLNVFFQGVGRVDNYLNGDLGWAFQNAGNIQQWQKDGAWIEGQTNAAYPRLFIASSNNTQGSTFWKQDGSYLRLKNLQLGYTLPKELLNSLSVTELRIYFACQNLLTWHHMPDGFDPEQSVTSARNSIPLLRTFSMGLNLRF